MSTTDTPRTDEFISRPLIAWDWQWIDFARQLERENAQLRAELAAAREEIERIAVITEADEDALTRLSRIKRRVRAAIDAAKKGSE